MPVYNVKDFNFGAYGDGVHDDTAAETSLYVALTSAGGSAFYPVGTYNGQGQTVSASGKRIAILGSGQASKLVNTSTVSSNAGSSLYIEGSNTFGGDWVEVADLYLKGSAQCGMGLILYELSQSTFRNLRIDGFAAGGGWGIGLNMDQYTFSCLVLNPVISNCSYAGIMIQNSANGNQIIGGNIVDMPGGSFAIRISAANGNQIIGTIIQGTGSSGQGGVELMGQGNTLLGCWIEANNPGVYANEPDSVIENCIFSGNTVDIAVEASSTNLVVRNCHFLTAPVITLASGSTGTIFEGCTGLTSGSITDSSGGKFVVRNCPGYNPVGSAVPGTAFSLPASGTAWTNNTGVDGTLFVTAAGTVTDVVVQGVTVGSSLAVGQSFFVPAGGTFTLTYSAAPTLVFVGN